MVLVKLERSERSEAQWNGAERVERSGAQRRREAPERAERSGTSGAEWNAAKRSERSDRFHKNHIKILEIFLAVKKKHQKVVLFPVKNF